MILKNQINDLIEIRDVLIGLKSIDDVVKKAIKISHERLSAQITSVYLYSKSGHLQRVGLIGVDKNGEKLSNNWFSDEIHTPGQSFTGKVIPVSRESKYGKPYWTDNLEQENLNEKYKRRYIDAFGQLNCAIAIPLNGINRTYGVIEVINKVNRDNSHDFNLNFTENDIYWLANIGNNLATAISTIRRRYEFDFLFELSRILITSLNHQYNIYDTYTKIVSTLIKDIFPYKVAILRVLNSDEELEIASKDGIDVVWDERSDDNIQQNSGIVGKVYKTGELVVIEDIGSRLDSFHNQSWIKLNKLMSFACFPLKGNSGTVGTLSVYTGHTFQFFPNNLDFLKNITYLVATIIENRVNYERLDQVRRELEKEREENENQRHAETVDLSSESILHDQKYVYKRILSELERARDGNPSLRKRIVENQITELDKLLEVTEHELEGSMDDQDFSITDINQIIRKIVKNIKSEIQSSHEKIEIVTNLSPELPHISAREQQIREIINNLAKNARSAILQGKNRESEIQIRTSIIEQDIPYIQIIVQDNGIGISNDITDRIFDKGFSKRPGGTGIGLYIVKRLVVNRFGGKINVTTSVGKGTSFEVLLPMKRLAV